MSSSNFLKLHDHFFELGEIIGNRRKVESYNGSCIRLHSANLFPSFCFWKSSEEHKVFCLLGVLHVGF